MTPRSLAFVAVAAALAGCSKPSEPPRRPTPVRLVLADSVDHLDALVREPMVVLHPSGALLVSGYWDQIPPLYKSIDRGATWTWTRLSTTRLWGRNLGDKQFKGYESNSLVLLGDPRTFGVTLSTQLWRTR